MPNAFPGSRLGIALLLAFVLGFAPPTAAAQEEAVEAVRDRPLPDRWRAHHLEDPIFGSRVYVVEAGPTDAPPVLLVHGLGQSGYQDWWEVIDALESDYHVIALDLPGFARSTVPEGDLSPPRYARLLDWLTRRLDLEGIHLVGHSMGGAVALYFAGKYPERIKDVVLADVAGVLQRVAFVRGVAAAQGDYDLPAFLDGPVKRLFNWGGQVVESFMLSTGSNAVEFLRRSDTAWEMLLADRPNVNAAISLLETDFSPILDGYELPTTIIWGAEDSVAPIRTGHLLQGRLPINEFRVIPEAGHVPMRTHSPSFLRLLRPALEAPPREARASLPHSDNPGDFTCREEEGRSLSGHFDRIELIGCPGMRLVDVRAREISVSRSPRVRMRHVTVREGLAVDQSDVTATDIHLGGEPAVRVSGGRLDLAGATLISEGAALMVGRGSTVITSVSRIDSGIRSGYLHGAVKAEEKALDDAAELGASSSPGQLVLAPYRYVGGALTSFYR